MATVLHVVAHHGSPRGDGHDPSHLLATAYGDDAENRHVRVLEAYIAPPGAAIADLALSERELPEVVSVLHEVDEVHVHGMPLALALNLIPYVKPEVLDGVPLTLHGPWPTLLRQPRYDATRLQAWPGPVHYDPAGAATPEAQGVEPSAPTILWLDPNDAALLPHVLGAVPHTLDDGLLGCVVSVSADIEIDVRERIAHELPRLSTPRLRIEVLDESAIAIDRRAAVRRVTQAAIVSAGDNSAVLTLRATLESIAQRIPTVMVGSAPTDVPDALAWVASGTAEDVALACVDAISPWLGAWTRGEAAPADTAVPRAWFTSRAYQP
ncbi:MAG: hypothetical protein V3V08_06750 [Nannocystaceae bacterium]